MAKNVFITFRFADGIQYKNYLSNLLSKNYSTVDFSEDKDRSRMSEETIKEYLYKKLRCTSVTIILLTPCALNHKKNWRGEYDDWMYDEIRYSLENRENNRTNGLVAVYTPEAANLLVQTRQDGVVIVNEVENLFKKNMMNIKPIYKKNQNYDIYDRDYDSYCSLVPWNVFINDIGNFIDLAASKRDIINRYNIVKRL